MKLRDKIINKLISNMHLEYFAEDTYLIKKIVKFSANKNPKVLDVGCGIGHYSFLFEKCGANAIGFDYDKTLIEKANEIKKELKSNVKFLIVDGRCPERHFTEKFDIVFMCGFALFGIDLDRELMEKYLSLLDVGGKLVFMHNSNLTGVIRKTDWRNHTIGELKSFFESLDCNIKKFYYYDRYIIVKILHSLVFNSFSTKMHILISKITKLPCSLVLVVEKGGYGR